MYLEIFADTFAFFCCFAEVAEPAYDWLANAEIPSPFNGGTFFSLVYTIYAAQLLVHLCIVR